MVCSGTTPWKIEFKSNCHMTTLLESIVVEPAAPANAAVIWMHGLGADGHDFEPVVPEFDLPPSLHVRFIFPHAPYRPITINGGHVMRGWYDIAELNSLRQEDAVGIRASAHAIEALLAQQIASGIPAQRIILAGFSQGAALALHTALRYPQLLAGIIALSGYLPLVASFPAEAHSANARTPIFLAHGTDDQVVPLHLGENTRAVLERNNYVVTWRTYPMPHSVCVQEIRDIAEFLSGRLSEEA